MSAEDDLILDPDTVLYVTVLLQAPQAVNPLASESDEEHAINAPAPRMNDSE